MLVMRAPGNLNIFIQNIQKQCCLYTVFKSGIYKIQMQANPQKIKKRQQYTRDQFSDKEVYNEIKDEIKEIRERNLKQVEEDSMINKLYEDKKRQMKITKMQINKDQKPKAVKEKGQHELGEEDEEEGEIKKQPEQVEDGMVEQGAPSIQDLSENIRPIIITRNRMTELLKARKFEQIIKGCFVRYKQQNSNQYVMALVTGIMEGEKQYILNNNVKIKTLLKLQQSSTQIIKLGIDNVSNQHPSGNLQISRWLQANRSKIPKEKQFKDKLQQLNNLIHGKVSSHDIDKNLLQQAERVASGKAEGTQNLSELLFFMRSHLHDLAVKLEELEDNNAEKDKYEMKKKQKKHWDQILTILIQKQKEAQIKAQNALKQKQDKKSKTKSYNEFIYSNRKQDKIRQIYQSRMLELYSHEGSNKIREQLQQAHRKFDIDIQI